MSVVVGAIAAVVGRPHSIGFFSRRTQTRRWVSSPIGCAASSKTRKLILYSKPGCCLFDGLKEKLHAAFLLAGPDSLHDVELEVRDITTNPQWEKAYQFEIPVLAKLLSDGSQVFFFLFNFIGRALLLILECFI